MTKAEWYTLATELQARWPNREIPEESVEIWFDDLAEFSQGQVRAAILTLYRDGREWCPTGAQIRARISELSRDEINHGEAWRLAKKAAIKGDAQAAFEWLREQSPAAAEAVKQMCGLQLTYLHENESTVRAQFRDIFNSVIATRKRDDVYAGLPSAGLRGLERGPRQIGAALKRALPSPPALGSGD